MWQLLCGATDRSWYLRDGSTISGSPPPLPQPIQRVTKARDDLAQLSGQGAPSAANKGTVERIAKDAADISASSKDARVAEAGKVLCDPMSTDAQRAEALKQILTIADETLATMQSSFDVLKQHYQNITPDQAKPLTAVPVTDIPIEQALAAVKAKPAPPEFKEFPLDVPPPLKKVDPPADPPLDPSLFKPH